MGKRVQLKTKREQKFDEIMGLDGAYQILKTEGFDALTRRLKEAGIQHKAARSESMGAGSSAYQDPVNPALLTAAISERLAAKAAELQVSDLLHKRLVLLLGDDTLETVYNRALVQMPEKALTAAEQVELIDLRAARIGLLEPMRAALALELGQDGYENLLDNLTSMNVFGSGIQFKNMR